MNYEYLIVERRGAVTVILINRPDVLNALNFAVQDELIRAMSAFDEDDSQGCAVLSGAGEKAFAAGADIPELAAFGATELYLSGLFDKWQNGLTIKVRKPWLAAVNGLALGGGCELAMMADMIIATDRAKFGQPEIKLGVAPGMGGTQRLARAVGKAKAMDLCLSGRTMTAAEAESSGLVARILPADGFLDAVVDIAAGIAAMPRVALLVNKEMVNAAFETVLEQGLLFERRMWQVLAASDDKSEGMNAFMEKRRPAWKHA